MSGEPVSWFTSAQQVGVRLVPGVATELGLPAGQDVQVTSVQTQDGFVLVQVGDSRYLLPPWAFMWARQQTPVAPALKEPGTG